MARRSSIPDWRAARRVARSKSRLAAAGIPLRRVHTVIVTHSHPDHFGAAGWVRHETGADIVTHRRFRLMWDPSEPPDVDVEDVVDGFDGNGDGCVDSWRVVQTELALRSKPRMPWDPAPWGGSGMTIPFRRRHGCDCRLRFPRLLRLPVPSVRLDDAGPIRLAGRDWVALHTPGHTEDHLCLFDPTDGVMLSGDHVLPTITPHIGGFGPYRDPLACFFDSLDKVAVHGPDTSICLPAHGHPFTNLGGPGRCHQAPPPRTPRHVAVGVRGHRSAGVGERVVGSPVLGPRPGCDGRQRDVRAPRAPAPRRRGGADRRSRPATRTCRRAESRGLNRTGTRRFEKREAGWRRRSGREERHPKGRRRCQLTHSP